MKDNVLLRGLLDTNRNHNGLIKYLTGLVHNELREDDNDDEIVLTLDRFEVAQHLLFIDAFVEDNPRIQRAEKKDARKSIRLTLNIIVDLELDCEPWPSNDDSKAKQLGSLCCMAQLHSQQWLVEDVIAKCLVLLIGFLESDLTHHSSGEMANFGKCWLGTTPSTSTSSFRNEDQCIRQLATIEHILSRDPKKLEPHRSIISPLLLLQATSLRYVSAAARSALLALLSSNIIFEDSKQFSHPRIELPTNVSLWEFLFCLADEKKSDQQRTNAYSAWLAITKFRSDWLVASDLLYKTQYWSCLQAGLATGSQQSRKLCLAILEASISLIDRDFDCGSMSFSMASKAELRDRYEKYATLFVTVVINRYANQVQECLAVVLSLFDTATGIETPWLVSLLCASMDKGMQESVRKVFGALTMDYAAELLARKNAQCEYFLTNRFLPWAVDGSLFVSSLKRQGEQSACRHGERLSSFVTRLLLGHEAGTDGLNMTRILLSFIDNHNDHAFPYAKAFILEGIFNYISTQGLRLDDVNIDVLFKIANQGGYLEIVGRWVACAVKTATKFHADQEAGKRLPKTYAIDTVLLRRGLRDFKDWQFAAAYLLVQAVAVGPPGSENEVLKQASVGQFCIWLEASNHTNIANEGLVAGCVYLREALEHDSTVIQILTALESLWEQAEIQEFGRDALRILPCLLLHKTCLALCEHDPDLSNFIIAKLGILHTLSAHRMHLFVPLACALRLTYLRPNTTSGLRLVEAVVNFANNPPVTKAEFQLEALFAAKLQAMIPADSYQSFYGNSEGYGFAAFFDMLNSLPSTEMQNRQCREILDNLLGPWLAQKPPVPVNSKWKTMVQLQVVLILTMRTLPQHDPAVVDEYADKFWSLLAIEPLPRYRYLLEWIIARIFTTMKPRGHLLTNLRTMDVANPKLCVSLIKMLLGLACLDDTEQDFAAGLLTQLVVLSASPKVAIRHEAQWSIPILWDKAVASGWTGILQNPAVASLNEWLRTLEPYKSPPSHRLLERFDPVKSHNLSNLLDGDYLSMEPAEQPHTKREYFVTLYADHCQSVESWVGTLPLGPAQYNSSHRTARVEASSVADTDIDMVGPAAGSTTARTLQTKGTSWKAESEAIIGGLASTAANGNRRPRDWLVVASLIDKAYNIGGLSRVSEIYGAASLVVADRRVLKSKDFTSVAVSSELWLPVEEVAANTDSLLPWLAAKKIEGYTIVGIEQTDDSQPLGDESTVLPERMVLVLGSEKEGIPALVLSACNMCVEIPQRGVTRSLNVQTAAGAVLFEADRQQQSQKQGQRQMSVEL